MYTIRNLFFLLFSVLLFSYSKPPELTPKDAKTKIEEILKAHVSYHYLTPELIKRTLLNYLDEIDPGKTYLLEGEVLTWTEPSKDLLDSILKDYERGTFEKFEELHDVMITAIKRRDEIEKNALKITPERVQVSDLKSLPWAKQESELIDRIAKIRFLQLETAQKLHQESTEQFTNRLQKRRLSREEQLVAQNDRELKQLVLTLVLKSVSAALDSQTVYFTPQEANQFMIQIQQKLYGIGAQLRDDLNGFTITRIIDGGPASRGNTLKIGDRVIAVNHEPVLGMELPEAVELIRGPQGTKVTLTVLREGEGDEKKALPLDVDLTRGEVVIKEARMESSFEPYGNGVIGIIHLFSFYQDNNSSCSDDVAKAIQELKKEHNLKGIIIDLRNNAGGLLPQAVAVTGLFIKKGVVVSVKDNTGFIQHLRNVENKRIWDGPLLVLTSRGSASAAEIVAQTLQEYGRALVVGDETTFGKGTFQTFTLESSQFARVNRKGEFKVTRGSYYTVSGKSPQLVGVKADIVIPGMYSELDLGEKFSKYPLNNDRINSSFEDDLSDLPAVHRNQLLALYHTDKQSILTSYQHHLPLLITNSHARIKENKNYQNFLREISKKDEILSTTADSFGQNDLQLGEAVNVMKDLICILHEEESLLPTGTS